ncbi:unnamed protein product, partial [Echinostoma caproni]|uniref:Similar to n=1 Tax=Echinostoma caproni TaxID=27848 RepID=A0A183B3S0_9TREM
MSSNRLTGKLSNVAPTTIITSSVKQPTSDGNRDPVWIHGTHTNHTQPPESSSSHPWIRQQHFDGTKSDRDQYPNEIEITSPGRLGSAGPPERRVAQSGKGVVSLALKTKRSNEPNSTHPTTTPQASIHILRGLARSPPRTGVPAAGSRHFGEVHLESSILTSNSPTNGSESTPIASHRNFRPMLDSHDDDSIEFDSPDGSLLIPFNPSNHITSPSLVSLPGSTLLPSGSPPTDWSVSSPSGLSVSGLILNCQLTSESENQHMMPTNRSDLPRARISPSGETDVSSSPTGLRISNLDRPMGGQPTSTVLRELPDPNVIVTGASTTLTSSTSPNQSSWSRLKADRALKVTPSTEQPATNQRTRQSTGSPPEVTGTRRNVWSRLGTSSALVGRVRVQPALVQQPPMRPTYPFGRDCRFVFRMPVDSEEEEEDTYNRTTPANSTAMLASCRREQRALWIK